MYASTGDIEKAEKAESKFILDELAAGRVPRVED